MPESGLREQYHHGDLRNALCRHALRTIETKGAEALSLRDTARTLGVSASAVYRHFNDKAALIAAVVEDGVTRLMHAMESTAALAEERAIGAAADEAGLVAMAVAYVRFAAAHPSHFGVMSAATRPAGARGPRDLLEHAVDRKLGREGAAAQRRAAKRAVFASIHGLAVLVASGAPEEREPGVCEASAREMLAIVLRGLQRDAGTGGSGGERSPDRPSPERPPSAPRRARAGHT